MSWWASTDDIEERYEAPIPESLATVVQSKLDQAERIIQAKIGDIAVYIASGQTTSENVRDVLCNMVIRWIRNPRGVRNEATGPWSYGLDSSVSSGKLTLDRNDRELLGIRRGATSLLLNDFTLPHPTRRPGRRRYRRDDGYV